MKLIHPHLGHAATLVAVLCLAHVAGCSNRPGGAVNPFLAPDRVPPPATRAILPGQAQPYYPGDPLPVMQSSTTTPAANLHSALASNELGSRTAISRDAVGPRGLAFSNEPTVAVPADNGDLRFPLPQSTQPAPITPIAATEPPQQPVHLAAVPASESVVPASYTEPVIAMDEAAMRGEPMAPGPWRSPEIPTSGDQVASSAPPMISGSPPLAPQPNSIEVHLRAVPSPPLDTNTPRIRLPGYAAPAPWTGAAMIPQPNTGEMVQAAAIGGLPAPPYDPALNLASVAPTGNNDGFRPRSSMR